MTDQYLLALKWLSPAAKTRAGDMVAEGGRAAARPGMKAPEGELDAFLFEVGRSRGQALMVVDSVARALDAAGDLAPARAEGAMETDRGRTYAERIEALVKLAREARAWVANRENEWRVIRERWQCDPEMKVLDLLRRRIAGISPAEAETLASVQERVLRAEAERDALKAQVATLEKEVEMLAEMASGEKE